MHFDAIVAKQEKPWILLELDPMTSSPSQRADKIAANDVTDAELVSLPDHIDGRGDGGSPKLVTA